jgi:hypothetical protein
MLDRIRANDFVHMAVVENGNRRWTLRASCQKCGDDGDVNLSRKSTLTQEIAEQNFRKKGWDLGSTRTKDVCPKCKKEDSIVRKAMRELERQQEPKKIPEADEEHKFIVAYIGEKLQQPNENGLRAYLKGWSDAKVAEELCVPALYPHIDMPAVRIMRIEAYGKARIKHDKPPAPVIEPSDLDSLKTEVADLRSEVARLQSLETSVADLKRMVEMMIEADEAC